MLSCHENYAKNHCLFSFIVFHGSEIRLDFFHLNIYLAIITAFNCITALLSMPLSMYFCAKLYVKKCKIKCTCCFASGQFYMQFQPMNHDALTRPASSPELANHGIFRGVVIISRTT